jgi:hypothetical protein
LFNKEAVMRKRNIFAALFVTLLCAGLAPMNIGAAQQIQQWSRFETALASAVDYDNPVQEANLKVELTAPSGKSRTMLGFWDGGRTWRVRFSPDELGQWSYHTSCSDSSNKGLHGKSGTFECIRYQGNIQFFRHGELRLSKNCHYLEHADGTPFFWLADTVWCGPLFADLGDWKVFLQDRVDKEFTAIQFVMTQWRMAKTDADGNPTFWGKEKVQVNPKYFQRLDKYVDAINEAGLLAVPVLLWAIRGDDCPGSIHGRPLRSPPGPVVSRRRRRLQRRKSRDVETRRSGRLPSGPAPISNDASARKKLGG